MKVHITNLYGFNNQEAEIQKQHHFAEVGRSMDFREMGIFRYHVDSDSQSELSTRLDGIIASIESGDIVFVQLPTGNGYRFDCLFVNKLKAYQSKVIFIIHQLNLEKEWLDLYRKADSILVLERKDKTLLMYKEFDDIYLLHYQNDYSIKKRYMDLIENVYYVYQRNMKELDNEIHIGFGLYDRNGNYSVWVGVAMQSILDHTSSNICFHILHDETLNEDNKRKLLKVGNSFHSRVSLHKIDSSDFIQFQQQVSNFSIGTLFRALLPEIISTPKVIYLDADIFVNCDIQELWNIHLEQVCLAAVNDYGVKNGAEVWPTRNHDVKKERYFNCGVLVMNLDMIRKTSNLKNEMIQYIKNNPESKLPDQDALNVIYQNSTLLIDEKWNQFVSVERTNNQNALKEVIYHFAGTLTSVNTLFDIDILYFETLCKTPWKNKYMIAYLRRDFGRLKDRVDLMEKVITKVTISTKLIFYGEETYQMKKLYSLLNVDPRKDYRILQIPNVDGILQCKNLDCLKNEKDFIVFVSPDADQGQSLNNLKKLGLKNEEDFIVIPRFVSYKDGGYIY